jgi:hypothetical protein
METAGLAAAAATFGGVWFGHVAVRWIEYRASRLGPSMIAFAASGLACESFALAAQHFPLSAFFGIFGATLLYDVFELRRQERRVLEGRAKANPLNPRHIQALASGKAVLVDPLDREPPEAIYVRRGGRNPEAGT